MILFYRFLSYFTLFFGCFYNKIQNYWNGRGYDYWLYI